MSGEHASCGPALEPSGFTYDPQQFMDSDSMYDQLFDHMQCDGENLLATFL